MGLLKGGFVFVWYHSGKPLEVEGRGQGAVADVQLVVARWWCQNNLINRDVELVQLFLLN